MSNLTALGVHYKVTFDFDRPMLTDIKLALKLLQ